MNWGLFLQFESLNIVDQPVFVYRFPVPGPSPWLVFLHADEAFHQFCL